MCINILLSVITWSGGGTPISTLPSRTPIPTLAPPEILEPPRHCSLYISILVDLSLEVVQKNLSLNNSWQAHTNLTKNQIIELLKFVLNNSYFTFEGTQYHQIFGCAMGSPVSAIFAELVTKHRSSSLIHKFNPSTLILQIC